MLKDIAIPICAIFTATSLFFGALFFGMHDKRYEPHEAASSCREAGKRLGEFRYDFGRSFFTCVDPAN